MVFGGVLQERRKKLKNTLVVKTKKILKVRICTARKFTYVENHCIFTAIGFVLFLSKLNYLFVFYFVVRVIPQGFQFGVQISKGMSLNLTSEMSR